jgi:isopenicillin-N N-acyltransferase like protein
MRLHRSQTEVVSDQVPQGIPGRHPPTTGYIAGVPIAAPFVSVEGKPFTRGAGMGEAFAGAVQRSVTFNRRYLTRHGIDSNQLERILQPYLDAASAALPHLVEQIRGMAEGAGQPFLDLFFANAFEEVYGLLEIESPPLVPLERCTDVVVRSPGSTLLGHNEQWYAGDDGSVGLVREVSDDAPVVLAPVVAGTLPLVGINELGVAVGTMSLTAVDEQVGVPRALVARSMLDSSSAKDAYRRADTAGRAGGYSYLCAFPGGEACVIESTATTISRLDLDAHTNHALDKTVATASCEPSSGSLSRLARAKALVSDVSPSRDGVAKLLADHSADGQDICVHPDPADGDEGSTILFAMICQSETRSLWLAQGHPCAEPFEHFVV